MDCIETVLPAQPSDPVRTQPSLIGELRLWHHRAEPERYGFIWVGRDPRPYRVWWSQIRSAGQAELEQIEDLWTGQADRVKCCLPVKFFPGARREAEDVEVLPEAADRCP